MLSQPRKKSGRLHKPQALIFLLGGKTITDNINGDKCALSGTAANHLVHTLGWETAARVRPLLSVQTHSLLEQELSRISTFEPLWTGLRLQLLKAPGVRGQSKEKAVVAPPLVQEAQQTDISLEEL